MDVTALGTLDDVAQVRRALQREPRLVTLWRQVPFLWVAATPWLHLGWWSLPFTLVAGALWLGSWKLIGRNSGVRALRVYARRALNRGMAAVGVGLLGVAALPFVAFTISDAPNVRYVVWPLCGLLCVAISLATTPLVARLDPTGIDSPHLVQAPDQPAVPDPLLDPAPALRACAALAYAHQVDADVVPRVTGDADVAAHLADLVAADYGVVHHDGERTWRWLTPAGRTAYRRHLRALLDAQPRS